MKLLHTTLGVIGTQPKSPNMQKVLKQNDAVTNLTA